MYTFQSLNRNLDVQLPSKRVVTFREYSFSTKDASIGEELTTLCGKNIWRMDNLMVKTEPKVEQPEETPVVPVIRKRRGRPPNIIQGIRMVEDKGEEQ